MKQIFGLLAVMILCVYFVYSNDAISQEKSNIEYLETDANVQNDSETSEQNDSVTNDDNLETIIPELEYLHEKEKDIEEEGYIVETYREYEIYKDKDGNIIKQVPTSNFNYLRYKKN